MDASIQAVEKMLETITKTELMVFAKSLEVVGRHDMTKSQLKEAIVAKSVTHPNTFCMVFGIECQEPVKKLEEVAESQNDVVQQKEFVKPIPFKPTIKYVEEATVGTIVAFKTYNGTVKSAKIINKSTERRKLKLETAYGKQFVVDFEDVIWVLYGHRWPGAVWQILKGWRKAE